MQCDGGLTGRFRTVDLHDTAARKSANAQGHVQCNRTGRNYFNGSASFITQAHDRALAEGLVDLAQDRLKCLFPIIICCHGSPLLMQAINRPAHDFLSCIRQYERLPTLWTRGSGKCGQTQSLSFRGRRSASFTINSIRIDVRKSMWMFRILETARRRLGLLWLDVYTEPAFRWHILRTAQRFPDLFWLDAFVQGNARRHAGGPTHLRRPSPAGLAACGIPGKC